MKSEKKEDIVYDIVIMMSTYNGEIYIEKQLKSIANQTYKGKVLLLIRDDGSTDSTIDIIQKWKYKIEIKLICDGKNVGPAYSFWRLLECAPEARYYAFVDQDDVWDYEKIAIAIDSLEKNKTKELWFSNCRLIGSNDEIIAEKMNTSLPVLTVASQLVCGIAQGCAIVFTKQLRKICLEYKWTDIPMHDTVIICTALTRNSVMYNENPLFSYRQHSNNVVAKKGKNIFGKISTTYREWFEKKHQVTKLAFDINNMKDTNISSAENGFLIDLVNSRYSILTRMKVINSKFIISNNKRGVMSFKIRVLLGIV